MKYALATIRTAHRFASEEAAKDAGTAFCQRFTVDLPFSVAIRSNAKWLCQIVPQGDRFSDTFLGEVTTRRRKPEGAGK